MMALLICITVKIPDIYVVNCMLDTVISNKNTSVEIKNEAKEAKKKNLKYYPTSNG
jgi:hypothetical protein